MSGSDAVWKILRCPECDGLMKIDESRQRVQIACPSCGALLGGDGAEAGEEPEVEVVRPPDVRDELPDPHELLEADDDLPAIPPPPAPAAKPRTRGLPDPTIPNPRREAYKMPELISNVGERAWAPGKTESGGPKLDASRMVSITDQRLAPPPEEEEGAVKSHVARKITGWDLDEIDEPKKPSGAPDQLRARLTLAGIGLITCLFVGVIIYVVAQSLKKKEPVAVGRSEKPPEEVAREALSDLEREAMDKADETFAAAGLVIEGFLNAPSYRERLGFVRDKQRVEPLMVDYYQRNPDAAFKFRPPEEGWRMQPLEAFLIAYVVGEDYSPNAIAVERQDDGSFLVDWESFVGYSEIPWEKIVDSRSTEPVLVRAWLSVGDYYNFGYKETEWACVQIQDPSREFTIYGYISFDSPVLDDLKSMMTLQGPTHVTVKIAHAGEGKGPKQFLITEVVARGWVLSESSLNAGGSEPAPR